MLSDILKTLSKNRAATMSLHDLLDQSREAIAEAKARMAAIEGAPQDIEAALASFDDWLDRAATSAVDRLHLGYAMDPSWRGPELPVVHTGAGRDATPAVEILLGLVALTGRETLRKVVKGQLADRMGGEAGMTAETRVKKVVAAGAEILSAELAEEAIIRAMEGAGLVVSRRPDASPLALLASSASLPD